MTRTTTPPVLSSFLCGTAAGLRPAAVLGLLLGFAATASAQRFDPPLEAPGLVLSAPAEPREGEQAHLLVAVHAAADSLQATVTLQEEAFLRVELESGCDEDGCPIEQRLHLVELETPPLTNAGLIPIGNPPFADDLLIQVSLDGEVVFVSHIALQAADAAAAPALPAEGYWYEPGRPGTGFFLQQRGSTMVVAHYFFDRSISPAPSTWATAAGELRGDTLVAGLVEVEGGGCLDCAIPRPPVQESVQNVMQLQFTGARRALLSINGGELTEVVSLPFGASYMDVPPPQDAGGLPLPDLRGDWLYIINEQLALRSRYTEAVEGEDGSILFTGPILAGGPDGQIDVECTSGEGGYSCELQASGLPGALPVALDGLPALPVDQVGESELVVVGTDGESEPLRIRGVRVDPPPASIGDFWPAQGFWVSPLLPRNGLTLQHRDRTVVSSVFTYAPDESPLGEPRWYNAIGELQDEALSTELTAFVDGDCLGCDEHSEAQPRPDPDPLRLEFESARRMWMELEDGQRLPFHSFAFGARYIDLLLRDPLDEDFGPLPLPDLQGRWAVVRADGSVQVLQLDSVVVGDGQAVFSGALIDDSDTVQDVELACEGGDAAGCELRSVDEAAGFSLGQFPLGNVEESRLQGSFADDRLLLVRMHPDSAD